MLGLDQMIVEPSAELSAFELRAAQPDPARSSRAPCNQGALGQPLRFDHRVGLPPTDRLEELPISSRRCRLILG